MDFFSIGPLAATIYFVICWAELIIIIWMISVNKSNKSLEKSIEEFRKILIESYIISMKKEDGEAFFKDNKEYIEKNKNIKEVCEKNILAKIEEIVDKLIKHDKRFFLQNKEMKSTLSRLIGNRRIDKDDPQFSRRKIDYYGEEMSEDIDSDDDGYKGL